MDVRLLDRLLQKQVFELTSLRGTFHGEHFMWTFHVVHVMRIISCGSFHVAHYIWSYSFALAENMSH
jgi:hypothetical protein